MEKAIPAVSSPEETAATAAAQAAPGAAAGNGARDGTPSRWQVLRDHARQGIAWTRRFLTDPGPGEVAERQGNAQEVPRQDGGDWLHRLMLSVRPAYKQALVVSLFVNLLALAASVFTLQVYDKVVFHSGLYTLTALVIGMLFVMFFEYILRSARAELLQRTGVRLEVEIGRRLFGRFLSLPTLTLESRPATFWQ